MTRLMQGIAAALMFFTRLPVARWYRHSDAAASEAAVYAPVAGALVGMLAATVLVVALQAGLPLLAAVLCVATGVLLTGALHEDAFGDYLDGFGAGGDAEAVIARMRDPRCGTFAVCGIVLLLLAQVAALAELGALLGERGECLALALVVVCAHALARLAAVSFMFFLPRVGASGSRLGAVADPLPRKRWPLAAMPVVLAFVALCATVPVLAPLALGAPLAAWALGPRFVRTLHGYTGDCVGAVLALSLCLSLVIAAFVASATHPV